MNPNNTLIREPMAIMNKIAMYTLFLNPKGKIITDAFIFRPKQY
jgi:glycine cleavage system aminomethyltransferase T